VGLEDIEDLKADLEQAVRSCGILTLMCIVADLQ